MNNITLQESKPNYFRTLFLRATRFPLLLFFSGLTFKSWYYWFQPLKEKWNNPVFFAKTGNAFFELAVILFVYLIILSCCDLFKKYCNKNSKATFGSINYIVKNGMTVIFGTLAINDIIDVFQLNDTYIILAHNLTIVVMIVTIAWILLEIFSIVETIIYSKYMSLTASEERRKTVALYTKVHIIRYIAQAVIILIATAASLMVFEKVRNIGISLLASAGFLTAVVALAAQKSLSSLFVGIQMVLSHPLEIGDLIKVEDKSGIVEEITLSYVIIRGWDSQRFIYPISYFIDKPFQNWSRATDGVLGLVKIYVDYTVQIDSVRTELAHFIKDIPAWDKKKFKVIISDFKENNIELSITLSALNPADLDSLSAQVREKLLNYICENRIDSFPKLRFNSPG